MADAASSRRAKRTKAADSNEPPPKTSRVTLLSPSLLLLEIPADADTSLPVWDALRLKYVDVAWTVNPYSVSVHLTPVTSAPGERGSGPDPARAAPPALSLCVLQPQMVVQPITQRRRASRGGAPPCVLLDSTQKTPPNPAVSVPLPLMIAQPRPPRQPGAAAKRGGPPPAPSKPVVDFHTRGSDVEICDRFLLGLCRAGAKCKLHHTPLPFHWQLWWVRAHQWFNLPPHLQVLLERLYCDVDQERFTLNFDSMALDKVTKYDAVRRLSNTDSPIRNPHFPNRWKIYWWNNLTWEEYNSVNILFPPPPPLYKLDFTAMNQTNVTTGFQREVRWRPEYRSPESMKPDLQTGVDLDPVEPAGGPPPANFSVDPLEEFSSWYPPVWCPPPDGEAEEELRLVDVPAWTRAYGKVRNLFYESLPETKVDIVSVQQVQNPLLWDKYQRHKVHMQKQHAASEEPLERHLFHGTTRGASDGICHNNFDPRVAGANGVSHGFGSYFATAAARSNNYSAKGDLDDVRHMFLAKVLVGKACVGRSNYRRPPPLKSKARPHKLYDTCVDVVDRPTMFVVYDSCQCYPYYLIKYRDIPNLIDI
uniref:Uncharacterized protein n=1 Tax=Scophthalmus maximus TaxID=52904 RepID=A0A8D2ZSW3_SCOMX